MSRCRAAVPGFAAEGFTLVLLPLGASQEAKKGRPKQWKGQVANLSEAQSGTVHEGATELVTPQPLDIARHQASDRALLTAFEVPSGYLRLQTVQCANGVLGPLPWGGGRRGSSEWSEGRSWTPSSANVRLRVARRPGPLCGLSQPGGEQRSQSSPPGRSNGPSLQGTVF